MKDFSRDGYNKALKDALPSGMLLPMAPDSGDAMAIDRIPMKSIMSGQSISAHSGEDTGSGSASGNTQQVTVPVVILTTGNTVYASLPTLNLSGGIHLPRDFKGTLNSVK